MYILYDEEMKVLPCTREGYNSAEYLLIENEEDFNDFLRDAEVFHITDVGVSSNNFGLYKWDWDEAVWEKKENPLFENKNSALEEKHEVAEVYIFHSIDVPEDLYQAKLTPTEVEILLKFAVLWEDKFSMTKVDEIPHL